MTRTLVLTVDRDNDLGVKTGIRGPVVGRRQVMAAALKPYRG
jgi:putative membrane protein